MSFTYFYDFYCILYGRLWYFLEHTNPCFNHIAKITGVLQNIFYSRRPGANTRTAVYRLWCLPRAAWTRFRWPWVAAVVGQARAPAVLWARWSAAWSTVTAGTSTPTSAVVSTACRRRSRTMCCCHDCSSFPSLRRVAVRLCGCVWMEQGTTTRLSLALCSPLRVTPTIETSSVGNKRRN